MPPLHSRKAFVNVRKIILHICSAWIDMVNFVKIAEKEDKGNEI